MRIKLNDPSMGEHDPDKGIEHARVVPELEGCGLDSYVPNGSVIDVPAEVAGSEPRWRVATDEDRVGDPVTGSAPLVKFLPTREHAGKLEVWDLGTGLLAQTDIWTKEAPAKTDTKNEG
jgi:hypothetical protein